MQQHHLAQFLLHLQSQQPNKFRSTFDGHETDAEYRTKAHFVYFCNVKTG